MKKLEGSMIERLKKEWTRRRRDVVQCSIHLSFGVGLFGLTLFAYWLVDSRRIMVDARQVLVMFAFSLLLFLCLGWMFYFAHTWLRNWKVRLTLLALLFAWTLTTCFCSPLSMPQSDAPSFLNRLLAASNSAATLIFSKQGAFDHLKSGFAVVNYRLLHLSLMLYLGTIMFSFLGREFFNSLRARLTLNKHKRVFWGLSERDVLMARSIVKSSPVEQVQFNLPIEKSYDAVSRSRLTDLADELGAFWAFMDFSKLRPKCHDGKWHYFLGADGHANLALANKVVDCVVNDNGACDTIELYVRAGDVDHVEIFEKWAKDTYERSGAVVHPIIISEPEMVARHFAEKYSPLAMVESKDMVNYDNATINDKAHDVCQTLLLGFDHTGRALLNASLPVSRFVGSGDCKSTVSLPFTVVDMKQERWDRYGLAVPEIVARESGYGIEFECMQVGMPKFEDWFRKEHRRFARIVFCLPQDGYNIREALRIRDILIEEKDTDKELLVKVEDPSVNEFAKGEQSRSEVGCTLKFFGSLSDIYSVDFFKHDTVDSLAKVLHWRWCVGKDPKFDDERQPQIHKLNGRLIKEQNDEFERLWENASYYERLSSRVSALGCMSFVRLLGFECVAGTAGMEDREEVVDKETVKKRIKAVIECLARLEHLRWCTFIRTMGIRKWDLDCPGAVEAVLKDKSVLKKLSKGATPNSIAKQIDGFRRHAALVEFDELRDVDFKLARMAGYECEYKGYELVLRKDGNEQTVTSLQGKDCDIWQVFGEAAILSGLSFRSFCKGKYNCLSHSSSSLLEENTPREPCQSCKPVDSPNKIEVKGLMDERLLQMAQWAKNAYCSPHEKIKLPEGCRVYKDFLNAEMIRPKANGGKAQNAQTGCGRIFWFDDAITPHIRSWAKRKSRLPFCFNEGNGVIYPFEELPSKTRENFIESIGVSGRRVYFNGQPGFVAQVFEFDDEIMVVFRGTRSLTDWIADLLQYFGRVPPHYRLAADLVRCVCASTDKNICAIGHSLGGGMVQYAVMKNSSKQWTGKSGRIRGVTFNSLRFSKNIKESLEAESGRVYAEQHIIHYRTGEDIVSGWPALGVDLIGPVIDIRHSEHGRLSVLAHKIDVVIRDLEKKLKEECGKGAAVKADTTQMGAGLPGRVKG